MVKKVYSNTVRNWLIGGGFSAGTLIGAYFLYLNILGAIIITGYSGDIVCAGTIEEPCYAYINFTANEDIFIYPTDYDPYGRNTTFGFDPAIKDWKFQRNWGIGWRDIPLNISCTGTWCGLSNAKDERIFSVAFRKGKSYQIRIVAYKKNPTDTIKWGAFDEIDPYWLPEGGGTITTLNFTERGLTWNKECINGICHLVTHINPINYLDNNGSYSPINQTFIPSTNPNYDWMIETGVYNVYFKENVTDEKPIKYLFDRKIFDYNMTFWLEPYALIWRNAYDNKQLINYTRNVVGYPTQSYWLEPVGDGHATEHIIHNDTDTFIYPDIFGYGTNLTFEYDNTILKKRLYVVPEDLPTPTINKANLTLDLIFKVDIPDKAKIWIKNNVWENGTIETGDDIFLKVKNKTLAILKVPYGKETGHWEGNDWVQRKVQLNYEFKIIDNDLYIAIRTPAKYLNNTDYVRPLEIDPSIQVTLTNSDDDAESQGTNCATFNSTKTSHRVADSTKPIECATIPVGWIFDGVNLGQGSTISDATIIWSSAYTCSTGTCKFNVYGVINADLTNWTSTWAPRNATKTVNYTQQTSTSNFVPNSVYSTTTITVTNITQEIVNNASWTLGDNMGFVTNDNGSTCSGRGCRVTFDFYSSDSDNPDPVLDVTFVDTSAPLVILHAPSSGSTDTDGNVTFQCNATDDVDISNIALYTNFTGSWTANQTFNYQTLALNKPAYNSSSWSISGIYGPEKAVDGLTNTYWISEDGASLPAWIYVDLEANYNIDRVKITYFLTYEGANFTIQASNDTSTWINLSNYTNNVDTIVDSTFNTTNARYIRVYVVNITGIPYPNSVVIAELQIYKRKTPMDFDVNGISNGIYIWNCWVNDTTGNSDFGASNWTINVSLPGGVSINYSVALPSGIIRFLNCSPDWEFYPSKPNEQSSTVSAINATNNGTATGNFQIKYIGSLNTGWKLYSCNTSSETDPNADSNCLNLSSSYQTIWSSVTASSTKQIWMYANCSQVSANPGVTIDMQAV